MRLDKMIPIREIYINDKLLLALINSKYYIEDYCKYFNKILNVDKVLHYNELNIIKKEVYLLK